MMRRLRILFASLAVLLAVAAPVGVAHAAGFDFFKSCNDGNANGSTVCNDKNQTQTTSNNSIYGPNGIISKIANIIALIVGVAAVIVIIIAGIQYMLSTGDPTKVNNAKNAILYAIVGLVITVLARTLVVFVVGKLGK